MRIRICLKESKESRLWLEICNAATLEKERLALIDEAGQFVKMFSTMIKNRKNKQKTLNVPH